MRVERTPTSRYLQRVKVLLRCILVLVILLILAGVGLFLFKNPLLRSFAEYRIRHESGLEVSIGRFEVGVRTPTVTISNFKLYNSPTFGGSPLIDMPELYLEYDPAALARKELHIKSARLNIGEVSIVEGKDGLTNLDALKRGLEKKVKPDQQAQIEFTGIDTLTLTIGKIHYIKLRHPTQNRVIDVGLKNEVARNVKSEADLSPVLLKILIKQGFDLLGGAGATPAAPDPSITPRDQSPK